MIGPMQRAASRIIDRHPHHADVARTLACPICGRTFWEAQKALEAREQSTRATRG
jgi:4-hydroxy-3-methylbut-2-en-1-yl diphosphate synthase IspG/GcpE